MKPKSKGVFNHASKTPEIIKYSENTNTRKRQDRSSIKRPVKSTDTILTANNKSFSHKATHKPPP